MFKKVTFVMDCYKATFRLATGNSDYRTDVVRGIPVVVQDDAVQAIGSLYAVAATNMFGDPTVFVNEEYFELPAFVKEFVLYHELGHVQLGHIQRPTFKGNVKGYFKNSVRSVSPHFGHVDERELQADSFAAEQIGDGRAMMALGWIMEDSIKKFGRGAHIKEMKLRINALLQGGKN